MMQKYFDKMAIDLELRGYTQATQESYFRRVKSFLEYTGKSINDLSMADVRQFIIYLKYEKKISFGTINAYLSAIKFFIYITLELDWDSRKAPRMKGYRALPAIMSKEEVNEILDSTCNLKHKAILTTMYGGGLRVSEVAKLKITDIDSKNMQIHIKDSKNRNDRYTILSEKNLKILREYWLKCGRPKDWLFPGAKDGNHINVKSIKNLFLKIKDRLKIRKKISAHTLRHCFAAHLLESGVHESYVQQLLGHLCPQSSKRYCHMTSKAMMNIKSPLDEEGN